jgi:hypothetical protein
VRVRLKGLNNITKRLADGTMRTYWYAWKGGPALRGQPGTPEFIASYNESCARKVVPTQGALLSILQQYQSSEDFTSLANSTRRGYSALIGRIEKEFADFPIARLPIVVLAESSRNGAIVSRQTPVAGRPTMHGPSWLGFCHGRSIADSLRLIRANVAAGFIVDHGPRRFGPSRTKRHSWSVLRPICTCR